MEERTDYQPSRALAKRRFVPVIVLLFLAPMVAELLGGSTPPVQFIQPFTLLFAVGLYGTGALLIREVVRRLGLGWPEIVLLGAANCMVEEGLQIQSFFNVHHPDLGILAVYGRALGVNWVWAEQLTSFHAIWSITIPIALTELLFPAQRAILWLGNTALKVVACFYGIDIGLGSAFVFLKYHSAYGYVPPVIPWLATLVAVIAIFNLVVRRPSRIAQRPTPPWQPEVLSPAPRPWLLRLFSFGAALAWFIVFLGLFYTVLPAPVPMLLGALLAWSVWRLIGRWSAPHRSFDDRHLLALLSGPLILYGMWDILILPFAPPPSGKSFAGIWLVGIVTLLFVIVLTWRTNRRVPHADTRPTQMLRTMVPFPPEPSGIPAPFISQQPVQVRWNGQPDTFPGRAQGDLPTEHRGSP